MAKDKVAADLETVELNVETLMSMGLSQSEAEAIVGVATTSGGSGLPFPLLKINYDADLELAKRGDFIADVEKDDKGNITSLTNFGSTIELVVLGSKYQYSKYDPTTNKAVVSSNLVDMGNLKSAYDLLSGISIATLKAADPEDKSIKFQEVMLVLASSPEQPTPKPYIFYSKGAFCYSLNAFRKGLGNNGNITHKLSFGLERKKQGGVTYFEVAPSTFKATPRSAKEIAEGVKTLPALIKSFTDWVASVNAGGSEKAPKASTNTKASREDDEDDISFD